MSTTYRRIEWASALCMVIWGGLLALPGDSLAAHPAYRPILWVGWREEELAILIGLAGIIWCAGLWINGRLAPSPLLRIAGCILGAAFWGSIATLLTLHSHRTGVWEPAGAAYAVLAAFDIWSGYHSGRDLAVQNHHTASRVIARMRGAGHGTRGDC